MEKRDELKGAIPSTHILAVLRKASKLSEYGSRYRRRCTVFDPDDTLQQRPSPVFTMEEAARRAKSGGLVMMEITDQYRDQGVACTLWVRIPFKGESGSYYEGENPSLVTSFNYQA